MKWFKDLEVVLIGFASGGATLITTMPKPIFGSIGGALAVTALMSIVSFLAKKAGEIIWNKYFEKKINRKKKIK